MNAYEDLVVRDVLMGEYGLPRELAEDLVRRNRDAKDREAKDLIRILSAWFGAGARVMR